MDLIVVFRTLWRHKILTGIVALLTIAGCAAVVFLVTPTYTITSSFLLVPPKAPPTDAEIAADPELGKLRTDNPFNRYGGDLSVAINVLALRLNSDAMRDILIAKGADRRYEVAPSNRFGTISPIVDINVQADSDQAALATTKLVGAAVVEQLRDMQAANNVDPSYMISTRSVLSPEKARLEASGKLRALIAVLALGGFALLVVISIVTALERSREDEGEVEASPRPYRDPYSGAGPGERPYQQQYHPPAERLAPDQSVASTPPMPHASSQGPAYQPAVPQPSREPDRQPRPQPPARPVHEPVGSMGMPSPMPSPYDLGASSTNGNGNGDRAPSRAASGWPGGAEPSTTPRGMQVRTPPALFEPFPEPPVNGAPAAENGSARWKSPARGQLPPRRSS